MTGGDGSDAFYWNLGDQGTSGTVAVDTITDFDVSEDKLNLSDLLIGEEVGGADINTYLNISYDGVGTTTINVSHDPGNASGVTQQILVNGDLTAGGAATIDTLITDGIIVVDV